MMLVPLRWVVRLIGANLKFLSTEKSPQNIFPSHQQRHQQHTRATRPQWFAAAIFTILSLVCLLSSFGGRDVLI